MSHSNPEFEVSIEYGMNPFKIRAYDAETAATEAVEAYCSKDLAAAGISVVVKDRHNREFKYIVKSEIRTTFVADLVED